MKAKCKAVVAVNRVMRKIKRIAFINSYIFDNFKHHIKMASNLFNCFIAFNTMNNWLLTYINCSIHKINILIHESTEPPRFPKFYYCNYSSLQHAWRISCFASIIWFLHLLMFCVWEVIFIWYIVYFISFLFYFLWSWLFIAFFSLLFWLLICIAFLFVLAFSWFLFAITFWFWLWNLFCTSLFLLLWIWLFIFRLLIWIALFLLFVFLERYFWLWRFLVLFLC